MRQLEKYVISGIRYIVWDELAGHMPSRAGCVRLLDASEGIGADRLVVIDARDAKCIHVFDARGVETVTDDGARYAAALSFGRQGQAMQAASLVSAMEPGARTALMTAEREHCEVRLTESFLACLLGASFGAAAILAG